MVTDNFSYLLEEHKDLCSWVSEWTKSVCHQELNSHQQQHYKSRTSSYPGVSEMGDVGAGAVTRFRYCTQLCSPTAVSWVQTGISAQSFQPVESNLFIQLYRFFLQILYSSYLFGNDHCVTGTQPNMVLPARGHPYFISHSHLIPHQETM